MIPHGNFTIMNATEASMFKQQFSLYHLRLIIFATEIAKTMLFHTTVYYICN